MSARIEIPEIKYENKDTYESKTRQKRGRPVGSKDKNPRKRKGVDNHIDSEENIPEKIENKKISKWKILMKYFHILLQVKSQMTKMILNQNQSWNVKIGMIG